MSVPLHKNVCEEHVYAKLYELHAKNLHDFIYYKYGGNFNPEDKVHEAFIKLWENCKNVPPEKAKNYLFTIANNLSLNQAKHNKVVLKYKKGPVKPHTQINPHHILEEKEYRQKFERALANLTDSQRAAFMMSRAEGKRYKEIAEMLQVSVKAVEKRIRTALQKLRKEIDGI
ncbi:MAG: RNA polymerase sigma factor [Marinirhabdus sp.]